MYLIINFQQLIIPKLSQKFFSPVKINKVFDFEDNQVRNIICNYLKKKKFITLFSGINIED